MNNILSQVGPGITAIDTEYVRPQMDASHLIVDGDRAAFVDTGTSNNVAQLLYALQHHKLDVGQVEYIFLTHIHLDHAGGAGALLQQLPNATVVVHQRGAAHIVDPSKLIAGTIAVYGEENYRRMYGDIIPVPAERILVPQDEQRMMLGDRQFTIIDAPGHALHHYCLIDEASRLAFTGDCFGVSYRELDTAKGPFIFPTTTPVHFDPQQMHATLDRIMGFAPETVYLTHYSRVDDIPRLADDLHRGVDAFVSLALEYADVDDRTAKMKGAMFKLLSQRLDQHEYHADQATRHHVLDGDIDLNVQGLEVWLERLRKKRASA